MDVATHILKDDIGVQRNMETQSSNIQSLERFLQIKKVVRATRKKPQETLFNF